MVTKNINIDLSHPYCGEVLRFHEGDKNGYSVKLNIFNNSIPFDLSGCTARYDAVVAGYLMEVGKSAEVSDNSVTITVTEAMTSRSGNLVIDVRILKDDEVLFFQTIRAFVQRRVINDSIAPPPGETIPQAIERMSEELEYLDDKVAGKMDLAPNGKPENTAGRGQVYYTDEVIGVKTSEAGSQSPPTYKEAYTKEASDARYLQSGQYVKISAAYDKSKETLESGQIHIDDAIATDTLYQYKNSAGTTIGWLACASVGSKNYTAVQLRLLRSDGLAYRLIDYSSSATVPIGPWTKYATASDLPNMTNYYTKTEINTMIGDIETLLSEV